MAIIKTNRRTFLRAAGGVAAASAAAPFIWIPKMSRAQMDIPADPGNKVICINLDGGARSVPMFNGNTGMKFNPFTHVTTGNTVHGVAEGVPMGVEWGVGGVFDQLAAYNVTVGGVAEAMPSLPMIANEVCVLGTVDHVPGAPTGEGNHNNARNWIGSGKAEGGPGIMSRVYSSHTNYTDGGGAEQVFPPVTIGTTPATTVFSLPDGPIAPVEVPSFSEFEEQSGDNGGEQPSWAREMEDGLDAYLATSRSARDRALVRRMSNGKAAVETFKQVFTDPAVKVASEPNAGVDLTNGDLQSIFGTDQIGRDMALALRFLQAGSSMVTVAHTGWDTHSNENGVYRMLCNQFARTLAGLSFALKRIQNPDGSGPMWNKTLICVQSEFGRDNLGGNGFNSGGGSDHVGGNGTRYQAFPYMGGLVTQGGKMFGKTDAADLAPMGGEPIFSTTSHMATMLAVQDINTEEIWPGVEPMTAIFNGQY